MIHDFLNESIEKSVEMTYQAQSIVNNLSREIFKIKELKQKNDSLFRKQNPYIVKSIIKYS